MILFVRRDVFQRNSLAKPHILIFGEIKTSKKGLAKSLLKSVQEFSRPEFKKPSGGGDHGRSFGATTVKKTDEKQKRHWKHSKISRGKVPSPERNWVVYHDKDVPTCCKLHAYLKAHGTVVRNDRGSACEIYRAPVNRNLSDDIRLFSSNLLLWLKTNKHLEQGWGTCGPRAKCCPHEHLIWPASEFSLHNLEYKIASKRSFMISRYLR